MHAEVMLVSYAVVSSFILWSLDHYVQLLHSTASVKQCMTAQSSFGACAHLSVTAIVSCFRCSQEHLVSR